MAVAADSIVSLYERHAGAWADARGRLPFTERPWLGRFVALLPPAARVLDLGCGSGAPIAALLAANGHRITGVDSSPSMIAMCRARLPGHEWRVGDMRDVALHCRYDGIIAWDSFFHLTANDQRRMLARFQAMARPGAPLMFTAGPRHGEAVGSFQGEPLFHASLDPDEYRTRLDAAGFAVLHHVIEDPDAGGRSPWLVLASSSASCGAPAGDCQRHDAASSAGRISTAVSLRSLRPGPPP
ncbi:MAG: class I SAM-dependent methyltransferase [Hyphomicrobiaceae bacterium]